MTADAGLAQIASRMQAAAGVGVHAELGAGGDPSDPVGALILAVRENTAEQMRHRQVLERAARSCFPIPLPVMAYPVTGGVANLPTWAGGSESLGPRDGYFWDVSRVVVDGLVLGGGTPAAVDNQRTSPAANATIAQIVGVSPGTYTVSWVVDLDGTVSATDINNFQLHSSVAGVVPGDPLNSENDGAVGHYTQAPVQITVPAGGANLTIRAAAAGTVGAIYSAQMTLTPAADDTAVLYKRYGSPGQERLHTFTASAPEWYPRKAGCMMRHPDALQLVASGLAASQLLLSGEGIQIEAPWIGKYLGGNL